MGALAMLLSGAQKPPTDYPGVPNLYETNVYGAGDLTRRKTPASSGQPQGKKWSAADFVTSMPLLIGK